ncbi:MAG: anthranilate synthase component I [Phycisphaerae bacterium]
MAIPIYRTLLSDHLTAVTAYERLATRSAYSFLLESVVGGERVGRYSFLGSAPRQIIKAYGRKVMIHQPYSVPAAREYESADPLVDLEALLKPTKGVTLPDTLAGAGGLPRFTGGAVGYAGYDTVRYLEPEKLAGGPQDDRHLPDLIFGIYDDLVIFDHVQKTILVVANAHVTMNDEGNGRTDKPASRESLRAIYDDTVGRLDSIISTLQQPLAFTLGAINLTHEARPPFTSNYTRNGFEQAVVAAKEYIKAGDIFQVVLSQRLTTQTSARPFDIYRALRVVNPSPYMFFFAAPECTLVGASPEIMCRVLDGEITNRPLAGTRRRGKDDAQDQALEKELLADPKERAEHIMLVDLGRNDVGRVAELGSIKISDVMTVERYSHVMHIVSNVTGKLAVGKTAFDALRMALPVGTVSGAPKIRAMQIIDELEPTKRGPYAGAVGYIDYAGNMDTAIALRTMVITKGAEGGAGSESLRVSGAGESGAGAGLWTVYVQAGAGLVADSVPAAEYEETLNKAAGMLKAVALAQQGLT